MQVAGLKSLCGVTLDRAKIAERGPWPRMPHKKPDILTLSELDCLLDVATSASLVPAVVSMAAYGAALRISEACRLRPEDLDSERRLIHVRPGKSGKDRYVMLSERLLEILRGYRVRRNRSRPSAAHSGSREGVGRPRRRAWWAATT